MGGKLTSCCSLLECLRGGYNRSMVTRDIVTSTETRDSSFRGKSLDPRRLGSYSVRVFEIRTVATVIGTMIRGFSRLSERFISKQRVCGNVVDISRTTGFYDILGSFSVTCKFGRGDILRLRLEKGGCVRRTVSVL